MPAGVLYFLTTRVVYFEQLAVVLKPIGKAEVLLLDRHRTRPDIAQQSRAYDAAAPAFNWATRREAACRFAER